MREHGSIAVYVILMTVSAFVVLLALLQQAQTVFHSSHERYYERMASEAAEAGATYATSCLKLYSHVQTWGPSASGGSKPDLTQSTDCFGAAASPGTPYVFDDGGLRTYFVVSDLDYSDDLTAGISATGYAELVSSTGTVYKTYETVLKKSIVWPTVYAAQQSVSGTYRSCAVLSGSAYCWGYNRYGQLGNNEAIGSGSIETSSSVDSTIPVKVKQQSGVLAGKTIEAIFTAEFHSCVLASGSVYCWGWNQYGQLGNGSSTTYSAVPVAVGGVLSGKTVTQIGGSGDTSCAIAEGKIYCWGLNYSTPYAYGTAGTNSTTQYYNTPQLVAAGNTSTTLPTDYTATRLSSSGSRSFNMCAIADDQAYCWGNNARGSVGDGTNTSRRLPTKVYQASGILQGKKIVDISQDGFYTTASGRPLPHACAVATDSSGDNGKAYCWGDNNYGQLGNNSTSDSNVPVAVRANSGDQLYNKEVTGIAAGLYHTCAVADEQAFCWGRGSSGQLGNNSTSTRYVPVAVSQQSGALLNTAVIAIGGGSNRGCAITDDARTFCWGLNSQGQIGDGTTITRYVPTESLYLRPKDNQYIY